MEEVPIILVPDFHLSDQIFFWSSKLSLLIPVIVKGMRATMFPTFEQGHITDDHEVEMEYQVDADYDNWDYPDQVSEWQLDQEFYDTDNNGPLKWFKVKDTLFKTKQEWTDWLALRNADCIKNFE